MPTRIPYDEPRSPLWMFTMGDLNSLLLIFFIVLFALLSMDKSRYVKLQADLGRAGLKGAATAVPGEAAAAALRPMLDRPEAAPKVFQAGGHTARVQGLPEGTALVIEGEEGGFREGDWRLGAAQARMLLEFKKWMAGRKNVVEVRGHASANLQDSAVLEPGGRIRPFAPADLEREDRFAAANHSLLSWLRAHEVARFLAAEHPELGDAVRLDEARVRVRADGYTRAVADSADPLQRIRNRRIEIVVTSELAEK